MARRRSSYRLVDRTVRQLASSLDFSPGVDIGDQLVSAAAAMIGLVITVVDGDVARGVCGQVEICGGKATITLGPMLSDRHRLWTLGHELGHILCEHGQPMAEFLAHRPGSLTAANPDLVTAMLSRGTNISHRQERAAERFAMLLTERLTHGAVPPTLFGALC
jgi:hypothetical protein